jgi:hypothetical protein
MNTAAPVRRTRTLNWPLIAFVAIHVALVTATLLLIPVFGSRLPSETRQDAVTWMTFELVGVGSCLFFIALRHEHRTSYAFETALPVSVALVGLGFSMLLGTVLINLDAHTYRRLLESPPGVGLVGCSVYVWLTLGRYIGAEATTNRLRRETALGRRSVWFAEVRVDRSWRLLFGTLLGTPTALLILWMVASQPAALPMGLWLAATLTLSMVAGERASVSITEGGIKVRGSLLLGASGWSLPLAEVSSARIIGAHPRQGLSADFRGGRCILRSGPALEVTSTTGGRYLVSLPEANEAVAVLASLRGRTSERSEGALAGTAVTR